MSAADLSGFFLRTDHKVAAVVTTETNGSLRAAPVESPYQDGDGFIWFYVSSNSFVVANVESAPELLLFWLHADAVTPAAISGSGFVITNLSIKQAIWARAGWSTAQADPLSGQIVLIRVSVWRTEYWDTQSLRVVDHRWVRTTREVTPLPEPASPAESVPNSLAPH